MRRFRGNLHAAVILAFAACGCLDALTCQEKLSCIAQTGDHDNGVDSGTETITDQGSLSSSDAAVATEQASDSSSRSTSDTSSDGSTSSSQESTSSSRASVDASHSEDATTVDGTSTTAEATNLDAGTDGSSSVTDLNAPTSSAPLVDASTALSCLGAMPVSTRPDVTYVETEVPAALGGEIPDAAYLQVALTVYGARGDFAEIPDDALTLQGGAVHHRRTLYQSAGVGPATSQHASLGTYTTTGSSMLVDESRCAGGDNEALVWQYTVDGSELHVFTTVEGKTMEQVFIQWNPPS